MINRTIIFLLVAISCSLNSCASTKQTMTYNSDTIGIKIISVDFESKVLATISKINNSLIITINDEIELIRLVNTIGDKNVYSREHYEDLVKYYKINFKKIIYDMKADLSKGGAYYSKEYDIYLGGKPHNKSQYYIIDK